MVDRKFVEAADALRFEMVNAHDGSFAPFVDRSLKDKIEAYDTARSRLAAAQPAEHPESIGGLASRTPASKQGKKALDDMLLVFAKHDDDEEDCWTQPARRGVQYVSDLEWDLETQVRLASHRAEANESLRIMLSYLAAYTGTHFGPDEPLKNYERVRKTLTDKPEPPAPSPQAQGEVCEGCGVEPARTYSADDVHLCVKCARENVDGSSLPAPEESATAQDGEPSVEECLRVAHEAIKAKHPHTAALAAQLIEAAKRIDWVQIGLNGDGCFHLEDGRFCLRGHRWPGHGGRNPVHLYEPLYVAMTRIAKASDAAPALAALVEAGDAMRAYFDETTLTMNRIRDKEAPGLMWALTEEYVDGAAPLLAAYDAARAEHERSAEK